MNPALYKKNEAGIIRKSGVNKKGIAG